jgi:hypothetical protein
MVPNSHEFQSLEKKVFLIQIFSSVQVTIIATPASHKVKPAKYFLKSSLFFILY